MARSLPAPPREAQEILSEAPEIMVEEASDAGSLRPPWVPWRSLAGLQHRLPGRGCPRRTWYVARPNHTTRHPNPTGIRMHTFPVESRPRFHSFLNTLNGWPFHARVKLNLSPALAPPRRPASPRLASSSPSRLHQPHPYRPTPPHATQHRTGHCTADILPAGRCHDGVRKRAYNHAGHHVLTLAAGTAPTSLQELTVGTPAASSSDRPVVRAGGGNR